MENTITLKNGLELTGATLLTLEEVKTLPEETLAIGRWWWLRSPGSSSCSAACVGSDSSVYCNGDYVYYDRAVRPALTINNLEFSSLRIRDVFQFADKEFEIISDTKALCTENVGKCTFREDWRAEDANNYETSDVKTFVDDWYHHALDEERGLIMHFPFMVNDVVYVRGNCGMVNMVPEADTRTVYCPFEGGCEHEECNDANSRIFETTVKSIWNEGDGWYFNVRNLYVDFPVSDVGRTVFLEPPKEEN